MVFCENAVAEITKKTMTMSFFILFSLLCPLNVFNSNYIYNICNIRIYRSFRDLLECDICSYINIKAQQTLKKAGFSAFSLILRLKNLEIRILL